MNIVNLTPHDITIVASGRTGVIKPSGTLARCKETSVQTGLIDGWIPVFETSYGEVSGLPEPAADTVYVVSALAANAIKGQGRSDVFIPAKTIRDANGVIIGCIGLAKI